MRATALESGNWFSGGGSAGLMTRGYLRGCENFLQNFHYDDGDNNFGLGRKSIGCCHEMQLKLNSSSTTV
jgi:hypothetical protein